MNPDESGSKVATLYAVVAVVFIKTHESNCSAGKSGGLQGTTSMQDPTETSNMGALHMYTKESYGQQMSSTESKDAGARNKFPPSTANSGILVNEPQ
jgi:hypothetical protein